MAVKYPWMAPLKKNNMDWHYEWPSDTTRVQYRGDIDKCMAHEADARTLLFQLKSYMKIPELDERLTVLSRTRNYLDGTTIYASSCWGIDTIIISATKDKKEEANPFCNLVLLDVPEVVPPMRYYAGGETWTSVVGEDGYKVWTLKDPWGVVEVEGVDYIKTYYTYSMVDCPGCISPLFNLSNRVAGQNISDLSNPNVEPDGARRVFRYQSERDDGTLIYTYEDLNPPPLWVIYAAEHGYPPLMIPHYMGDARPHAFIPPEPKTHTIYSLDGMNTTHKGPDAQAEIIKFSSDAKGAYILWKAYTDYISNTWVQPRNGLGYMRMNALGYDGGVVLCESATEIIKVDCCEKTHDQRLTQIWWEGIAGSCTAFGVSFRNYGGISICLMPALMPASALYYYTSVSPQQPFYSIVETNGTCLPVEWDFKGTLRFREPSEKYDQTVWSEWTHDPLECHDEVEIFLNDRCPTGDYVRAISCCNAVEEGIMPELSIDYTSLSMTCGGIQSFSASGGCAPFEWSSSGGGTINEAFGASAQYHAPDTNTSCLVNPIITVIDCCGKSASITLNINCWSGSPYEIAYGFADYEICEPCHDVPEGHQCRHLYSGMEWNCLGQVLSSCPSIACEDTTPNGSCAEFPGVDGCGRSLPYGRFWCGACNTLGPGLRCGAFGVYTDIRTALQKEYGCCPSYPLTGGPWP